MHQLALAIEEIAHDLEVFAHHLHAPVDVRRWVDLARNVLLAEGVSGDAELSLLFVDEDTIAGLNQRFMDADGPTDVLAFPIDDPAAVDPGADVSGPASGPLLLGDVVVCPAVAVRQAPDHGASYEDELALLVVHALARCAAVAVMVSLPYAGDAEHAKAKPLAQRVAPAQLGWALMFCLPLLALLPRQAAWLLLVAALLVLAMRSWLRRRLGGYTGDTLGATEQLAEAALLLALAAA